MSMLEIARSLPFDSNDFEKLKALAQKELANQERRPNAQALALLSTKKNLYSLFLKDALDPQREEEAKLLNQLSKANDTQIHRILCLWQDGGMDLPSHALRSMLCSLNPANGQAGIFVQTAKGSSVIELKNTLS